MGSDLEKRIRDLPPEQLNRLWQDLQHRGEPAGDEELVLELPIGVAPPLSFAQRRLWFLHQLQPDSAAYNALDAMRLRGRLDARALARSLNAIVQRHEVLRTTFVEQDGEPVQVVAREASWPLEQIDLRTLNAEQQEVEIRRLADEQQHRSFDLARGPLVQATLLELSDDDHVLLLRLHHVVADGWSIGILRQELAEHYRAFSFGVPPQLPTLPHQYGHFAYWQRARLTGEPLARLLGYWRDRLEGLPTLRLPTDHPPSAVLSGRGREVARELPRALLEAISAVGQRTGATEFMTLLAAFQVLLSRYSGQTDFALGTPIANRGRREWEGLVGFFVNSLVMRADLSGNPSFCEYLAQVRETALEAYAHQELPFEMLVQELAPDRHLNRNPLFQVMFGVQRMPPTELGLGDLTLLPVGFDVTTSRFDLEVNLWEHPQGLRVVAYYGEDRFERSTIESLLQHFERLLQGIAADPDRRVTDLPLVTDAEKRSLLASWNALPAGPPTDACLHELFQAQANRTPDMIAITSDGDSWTYRWLDQRSTRLADRLRVWGVGADVPVALCLSRSPEIVAAILAVLKAGGAYVPMEPELPSERLAYILEETQAPVVVTDSAALPNLPALTDAVVYCLDTETVRQPPSSPRDTVRRTPGPDNLAYLMYTSGSTGRPKAVAVTHRNVVRLFRATEPHFQFDENDVWTLFHSYAFDFSVWEIWGALLFGGRLIVVPWTVSRSPREFCRLLVEQGVTVLNQTPTAFGHLLQQGGLLDANPSSLRWVIFGGERLELRTLLIWFDRFGDGPTRLVNMYGITETTVHTTLRTITAADARTGSQSPIGVRLPDVQIYVLDPHGNLAPPGVPGEVFIGGAGLARGYWGDAALTADRFRPHPFSAAAGARVYRTGDRARFLHDGSLEYLGRCDGQIKIRGIRMEPGEIEAALRELPQIQDVVVTADEDTHGERRLAAYVVPAGDDGTPTDVLQRELRRWLPPAMIPSVFVPLKSLPRTAQGKLDRRALPKPGTTRPALTVAYGAPRTPVEQAVAEIWQETLQLERVGVHDNFFDLGGHSLQAARVISRLREAFQIELPLQRLFEAPALADLAEEVETGLRSGRTWSRPPLRRLPRETSPRLSFAQQRLWFLCQMRPDSGAYHIPMVVELRGRLNVDALEGSLDAIVQRHDVLRTTFPNVDGNPVQRIADSGTCSLQIVDLGGLPESQRDGEMRRRAAAEQGEPFDLESGPLMRARLLRLEGERHVLLLTMHHIISDGWSIGILRRELAQCYRALDHGQSPQLPSLPVQYADFAEWQEAWLGGEVLQTQLAYWRQQLAGLSTLRLPADRPPPAVSSDLGGIESLSLPAGQRDGLSALNRREGATLFITMLTAFQVLLARYSGQTDVAVGSPIANRGHSQIEGLIGFFVNSLVLRTDLGGDPTFRELLHRVRGTAITAYAHQDLPFERLVEELQPDRVLDQNPLFQVMFAVQNAPMEELELPGLTIHPLPYPVTTTRFDLQWDVIEHADGLQVVAYYRAELFDPETIRRMLGHYRVLLERVLADPDRRLSELSVLSDIELRRVWHDWNETACAYPDQSCLHQLFAAQVARTPDRMAVVCSKRCWTYHQLLAHATRVARRLMALGVGPETPVGLCVERGSEMVAAVIGILQAGGAYVPLDPDLPRDRLRGLLDQAAVPVLVTQRAWDDLFHEKRGPRVVCLEDIWAEPLANEEPCPVACAARANNLACIMFTSGSTGVPKGIGVPHRAVVRLVLGHGSLQVEETDVVAQAANPSFDATTFELWGPLLSGARLVITDRDVLLSPVRLDAHLQQHEVSVLFLTTALFNELARDDPARFKALRCLLFGGEAVDAVRVRQVLEAGRPAHLLHMYGPTETTTFATAYAVEEVPEGATTVPIGSPIANTQVYLLDDDLRPVPMGVPGEVYVGGPGLARGYWNDPSLTAAKFVPHPCPSEPGQRLYRTGDLARYRSDGCLEFVARRDDQVKLRGFRVELGDVRAAVRKHPAVRECEVIVREEEPGDKRLIAYVTAETERFQTTEQQELLADWGRFFDDLYRRADSAADPRSNLIGWTSSYTGRPLSVLAMREQIDQTVDRIVRHRPRRVLEIGCGTGLLLFRIAPECKQYWGTDISPLVLQKLRAEVAADSDLGHVVLWQRTAADFSELPEGGIDAVVLNSVVQYFPSIEYLRTVLEDAARLLAPGGMIFLGDVRSLPLWEAFQTTVELLRAPESLTVAELRRRVAFEMAQETELLVHPRYFRDLLPQLAGATDLRIEPKRGHQQHELTQFRYDVTIRFNTTAPRRTVEAWQDWCEQPCSVADIRRRLADERPDYLAFRSVTNARVSTAVESVRALRDTRASVGELRERLFHQSEQPEGIDPEDLWMLADGLPYRVDVDWSEGSSDGCFHVILQRIEPGGAAPLELRPPSVDPGRGTEPVYGNRPLRDRVSGQLFRDLREQLKRQLPEYMLPAAFVLLDRFPLTRQGKVDRTRLPPPDRSAPAHGKGPERAPTPTEETLRRIWCDVLRLPQVGLHDNFFDLGGHSLMAMQVCTRLREKFGLDLPVRRLFEAPTIAELALRLTQQKAAQTDPDVLLQQLEELEQLTEEQVRERFDAGGDDRDE